MAGNGSRGGGGRRSGGNVADRTGVVPGKFFEDGKARRTMSLNETRAAVEAAIGNQPRMDFFLAAGVVKTGKKGLAVGREPKTAADWRLAYKTLVGVPMAERGRKARPGVINGVDIHRHFRPWTVFGLNPKTATKSDVERSFRNLAKRNHPDVGGRRRDFERLKTMRDSILALM